MSSVAQETPVAADWPALDGSQQRVAVEVLRHGPLPRAELARRLGLSAGSLTRLTRPLVDSGLLVEGSTDVHTRTGRPSLPLDVAPSARRFLGMKITGDTLFGVVTDMRATVLAEHTVPLPARDPAAVVATAAAAVEHLRSAAGGDVAGLGVGIGGFVRERREVARAHYLRWDHTVPLADLLEEAAGLPSVVENDVRALTVAEHWFGPGRGMHSLVVITIGVGVGCGIVVHDRLVEGAHGGGGSIGHRPLFGWGVCADGHRGCAHALLASDAIAGAVAQAVGHPVDHAEALALARAGQPAALRVVRDGGRALGLLVADIANLVDPELVILTGDGIGLVDLAGAELDAAVLENRNQDAGPTPVEVRPFPFTEWARGGAAVAIQTHVLGTAGAAA
ncbi:ROK family transcriptional regulator [Pseudonocardia aurantiaca]|uniref:ROK family transcriptional regulator n=1 Tax=Pseudonocardia aurantiaca TaxID=75290 RepID=A0ABW4FV88_9PSEU